MLSRNALSKGISTGELLYFRQKAVNCLQVVLGLHKQSLVVRFPITMNKLMSEFGEGNQPPCQIVREKSLFLHFEDGIHIFLNHQVSFFRKNVSAEIANRLHEDDQCIFEGPHLQGITNRLIDRV